MDTEIEFKITSLINVTPKLWLDKGYEMHSCKYKSVYEYFQTVWTLS